MPAPPVKSWILRIIIQAFTGVSIVFMLIIVFFVLILAILWPKTEEISRYTSPDGKVDAVLKYTTEGAMGRHYNSLYIVPSRKKWNSIFKNNEEILVLRFEYGNILNIVWSGNECLTIKYETYTFEAYQKYISCCGKHIEIQLINTLNMPTSKLTHEPCHPPRRECSGNNSE